MSSKEREGGEVAGVWANGEQLILQVVMMIMIMVSMMARGLDKLYMITDDYPQLDEGSLKLIETDTGETLNCQVIPPHSYFALPSS